jgi:hypothetical protein
MLTFLYTNTFSIRLDRPQAQAAQLMKSGKSPVRHSMAPRGTSNISEISKQTISYLAYFFAHMHAEGDYSSLMLSRYRQQSNAKLRLKFLFYLVAQRTGREALLAVRQLRRARKIHDEIPHHENLDRNHGVLLRGRFHSRPDLLFDKSRALGESPNVVNTTDYLPRVILQSRP